MSLGKMSDTNEIPLSALQRASVPRRKTQADDERSVDMAMIRILARKRPNEFRKIAEELFGEVQKI